MVAHNVENLGEVLLMVRLLTEVGYRDLALDANGQRLAVARRLSRLGVDSVVLGLLWEYARVCGHSPIGLFAYWLSSPELTMRKIGEMRAKNTWLRRRLEAPSPQEGRMLEMPRARRFL